MRSRPLSSARSALLARRARQMLLAPQVSELKLWAAIRGQRLGVSFRRQVVVGKRIVDFLAPAVRLVVEVDGGVSGPHAARGDARRDAELEWLGYRVLRLEADLVMHDLPVALARIAVALAGGRGASLANLRIIESDCCKNYVSSDARRRKVKLSRCSEFVCNRI